MSNSDIEQTGTVKGHLPNGANLSGRISNGLSLSGHISIGSVASDFIIKMTLAGGDDGNYTLASCDATVEQIDAAVSSGKRAVVIASDGSIAFELPMLQGAQGIMYAFGTFMSGQMMTSFVQKIDESTSEWQFLITQIQAESVDYSNDALPNVTNVKSALDDTIDTQQTQSADLESLRAGVSALMNAYQTQGGDITSLKTQAHTHSNKPVLDKFAESDGKPTYNGEALGGGAGDFIIKMTATSDDNGNYTVTSCDTTVEQIDAAVANEKMVVVIASYNGIIFELPMLEGIEGYTYYFGMFLQGQVILSFVQKVSENESEWRFGMGQILSEDVGYSNDALPNMSTVGEALDKLVPKSHSHDNKSVLDKFSETDGKPTYDGEALGGGTSDFIIKMTLAIDDDGNYTLASCDATVEQIDAAVAAEKRVIVIASADGSSFELPMLEGVKGVFYYFGVFLEGQVITSFVEKIDESTSKWNFAITLIQSGFVGYSNAALPSVTDVRGALDALVPKSHTHANKDALDKLSVSNGKLQYNGSDVGLKPVKGTDYWTESDKAEIVADTLAALPTWTGGSY